MRERSPHAPARTRLAPVLTGLCGLLLAGCVTTYQPLVSLQAIGGTRAVSNVL
jgi:hypothetical protein